MYVILFRCKTIWLRMITDQVLIKENKPILTNKLFRLNSADKYLYR